MSHIRESARGEDCTIRLEFVCNFNPETTVLCHANTHRAGKAKSKKSADFIAAYGCSDCHDVVDRRRNPPAGMSFEHVELAFWHGVAETQLILERKGLIVVK